MKHLLVTILLVASLFSESDSQVELLEVGYLTQIGTEVQVFYVNSPGDKIRILKIVAIDLGDATSYTVDQQTDSEYFQNDCADITINGKPVFDGTKSEVWLAFFTAEQMIIDISKFPIPVKQ